MQEYQIHLWAELGWYTSQVSATKAFNNRSFFCAYDARDQNGSEDRSENTRECIHCAWEPVLPYVQTHAMHSDIVELKEGFKRSGCVSIVFVIRVGNPVAATPGIDDILRSGQTPNFDRSGVALG